MNLNFREFLEGIETHSGAIGGTIDGRSDYTGHAHDMPDSTAEFPTFSTQGKIFDIFKRSANKCYRITGGTTACIPLPKLKTMQQKPKLGDSAQATFYSNQESTDKNYKLQKLEILHSN